MKKWLKYGIIGGIISGGFIFIRTVLPFVILRGSSGYIGPMPDPIFILSGLTLSTLLYFLIGAIIGSIIGFIVGKIKSKK